MGRWAKGITACGVVLCTLMPVAFASTVPNELAGTKEVSIDGVALSYPEARVAYHTTYMPIWYVGEALKSIPGVTQHWNGVNHEWSIQIPDFPVHHLRFSEGDGNTTIIVNGVPIKQVDTFAAVDPASNKETTYMPIFYVQEIMRSIGVHSSWNGFDWDIHKFSYHHEG